MHPLSFVDLSLWIKYKYTGYIVQPLPVANLCVPQLATVALCGPTPLHTPSLSSIVLSSLYGGRCRGGVAGLGAIESKT